MSRHTGIWVKVKAGALAVVSAALLAGCATFPRNTTVADYCANPKTADEAVCQLNVEINGNRMAISDTNLSVTEARRMADASMAAANRAQSSADAANRKADEALSRANAALAGEEDLYCETRVIQKTDTGSCAPGFKVMSCTQTRYTTRAGGLSFLREINDQQCRFNSRVLEMQVRCCALASTKPAASSLYGGTVTSSAAPASTTTRRVVRRTYTVPAER